MRMAAVKACKGMRVKAVEAGVIGTVGVDGGG